MNERKIKEIERLVDKFFLGETTTAEERRLYRLFGRKRLPDGLERLRPMFEAFASMDRPDEARRARMVPMLRRAAVAAAAAVALVLCLTLYAGYHEDRALARLYGGSYVIVDGKRIDDLSVIRGDIEQTLTDARRIESHAEAGFIDGAERDVLMSIDDPDVRREVEQMLNE